MRHGPVDRLSSGSGGAAQQHFADGLLRLVLVAAADRRDFAGQTLQRGFVKLTLGIALLALVVGAVQVAHHLGDGDQIARVDLLFVFLGPARPHGLLDLRLAAQDVHGLRNHVRARQRAHADICRLAGRHAQRHLVLLERDDEQLELETCDLLLLDRHNATDSMRRIDDIVIGTKLGRFRLAHVCASLVPTPPTDRNQPYPGGQKETHSQFSCETLPVTQSYRAVHIACRPAQRKGPDTRLRYVNRGIHRIFRREVAGFSRLRRALPRSIWSACPSRRRARRHRAADPSWCRSPARSHCTSG